MLGFPLDMLVFGGVAVSWIYVLPTQQKQCQHEGLGWVFAPENMLILQVEVEPKMCLF